MTSPFKASAQIIAFIPFDVQNDYIYIYYPVKAFETGMNRINADKSYD